MTKAEIKAALETIIKAEEAIRDFPEDCQHEMEDKDIDTLFVADTLSNIADYLLDLATRKRIIL